MHIATEKGLLNLIRYTYWSAIGVLAFIGLADLLFDIGILIFQTFS